MQENTHSLASLLKDFEKRNNNLKFISFFLFNNMSEKFKSNLKQIKLILMKTIKMIRVDKVTCRKFDFGCQIKTHNYPI